MASDALALSRARGLAASGEARERRLAARLSIAELAAEVGVAPATVSRWESGQRRPRGAAAIRYERLLDDLERQARDD